MSIPKSPSSYAFMNCPELTTAPLVCNLFQLYLVSVSSLNAKATLSLASCQDPGADSPKGARLISEHAAANQDHIFARI